MANFRDFYPDGSDQSLSGCRLSAQPSKYSRLSGTTLIKSPKNLYFLSIFALMGNSSIKTLRFYMEMVALCSSFVIGRLVVYPISSASRAWFPKLFRVNNTCLPPFWKDSSPLDILEMCWVISGVCLNAHKMTRDWGATVLEFDQLLSGFYSSRLPNLKILSGFWCRDFFPCHFYRTAGSQFLTCLKMLRKRIETYFRFLAINKTQI